MQFPTLLTFRLFAIRWRPNYDTAKAAWGFDIWDRFTFHPFTPFSSSTCPAGDRAAASSCATWQ